MLDVSRLARAFVEARALVFGSITDTAAVVRCQVAVTDSIRDYISGYGDADVALNGAIDEAHQAGPAADGLLVVLQAERWASSVGAARGGPARDTRRSKSETRESI